MTLTTGTINITKDTSSESDFNSEEYNSLKHKNLTNAYYNIFMPKMAKEEVFIAMSGTTCNTITQIGIERRKEYEQIFPIIDKSKVEGTIASLSQAYIEPDIEKIRLALDQFGLAEYAKDYLESYLEKLWMSLIGIFDSGDPHFAKRHDQFYK